MERIVAKFGGSSVADAAQFRKVAAIMQADPRRRILVVSAPGKRRPDEAKITDLLYLCHDMAAMATSIDEPFGLITERFTGIAAELGIDSALPGLLQTFRRELEAGCSREFAVSRGEFFCARLMAEFLGAEFVDPANHILLRGNGLVDPVSYERLRSRLADESRMYVMAGFYGRNRQGEITTFSRGGSDISGAIAARAAGAILYENWTDTSGFLIADPRIVDNPRAIEEISFREVREMAYMGASVFHDEAILPVREAKIPINIKNTNRPQDPGTMIVPVFIDSKYKIAGIAGKKHFCMINLEKSLMNKEVGFVHNVLGVLARHGISFEHCPTSIDSMSVILEERRLADQGELVLEELKRAVNPDRIELLEDLALIAVVGEELADTPGMASKVFTALAEAGINVRIINQGASELNIIVGVKEADYEPAVRALYQAFVSA